MGSQTYWHNVLKHAGHRYGKKLSIMDVVPEVEKFTGEPYTGDTRKRAKKYLDVQMKRRIAAKKEMERETEAGVIYFVGSMEHGWCKIGKTVNLRRRVATMQTGCPFTIDVLHYIKTDDTLKAERVQHRKFNKHRIRGEWFNIEGNLKDYLTLRIIKGDCAYF